MIDRNVEQRFSEIPLMDPVGHRGQLLLNEPLARYTSWRVGGPADRLYKPVDREDLVRFLSELPDQEPVYWVGLGSNLLVRDGGIRGTVVNTRGRMSRIHRDGETLIYVEAGVPCAQVARFCSEAGMTGGEFLAGIPGTMGGALAMNAGAFGGETWGLVGEVHSVDKSGRVRIRRPGDYKVGYRTVSGPGDEWFLAAKLAFIPGDGSSSRDRIRNLLAKRADTQPLNKPSCGSVFKNPPGDHAARLIEACGLKGYRIGGAIVSDKHANFILNSGSANAEDIEMLIVHLQNRVRKEHGIELLPEVRIVGEHPLGNVQ